MSEELRSPGVPSGARPHQPEQPEGLAEQRQPEDPGQLRPPGKPGELERAEPGPLEPVRSIRQLDRSGHRELTWRRERTRRVADPDRQEHIERPTDRASLEIDSKPVKIKMDTHGPLGLGIVGPAATIGVGHLAGLPTWAIVAISAGQVAAAVVTRHWR